MKINFERTTRTVFFKDLKNGSLFTLDLDVQRLFVKIEGKGYFLSEAAKGLAGVSGNFSDTSVVLPVIEVTVKV